MTLVIVHEDQVDDMWTEYLKNVDDYDKRLTDGWKDDANGVLVFVSLYLLASVSITVTIWKTGLFSAIVASFIIESYKLLSPDSGSQSVFLLGQLSQQFAGFANGTHVQPQSYTSSPPSVSIIWVNILWLLSFLLSTTSALFATLMLQWARIYIDLPRTPSVPKERARVRSVLFFGTETYRMHLAVKTAPALLHLSVFLFFTGLVVFFFTISKTVAIVILISVGFFGSAYFALTILPCIDYHCPYRTPMSSMLWYIWRTFLFSVTFPLRWILKLLHYCLVPYNFGDVTSFRQRILTRCFQTIDNYSKKHLQNLRDGFRRSIVQGALDEPVLVDIKALTWLFGRTGPGLAENSKLEEFVANIPGGTITQLMSSLTEPGKIVFRDHLLSLLRSCAPGTVWLDEDMRRRRLLVCLNAIHHIAKASTLPYGVSPPEFVLSDLQINFAKMRLMRSLWTDGDPSIRIISRSICALLARYLLRKDRLEGWELAWLQNVMGKSSHTILNALANRATVDSMNLDAYVYGVLSRQTDDLSIRQARSFMSTLKILTITGTDFSLRRSAMQAAMERGIIALIERADSQDNRLREVVGKLRRISEEIFSSPAPDQQAPTTSS